MATNAFEDSRISEGTLHAGAQHVANLPNNMFDTPGADGITKPDYGPSANAGRQEIRRLLGATTLAGDRVRNPAGEDLGSIEETMLDIVGARIAYAVISFGGLFGIGSKLFLVPWSALRFNPSLNEFILDVDRDVLKNAPGFDHDNWPKMDDPAYGAEIHRHYGKAPYWQ